MSGTFEKCLHDAELVNVAVDRTSRFAQLDFRLEDGVSCAVELHGLKAFRSEDLTLQNVVSRLLRSSRQDMSEVELTQWLTWVTSLSDASSWLSEERKREWVRACVDGALELLVIEPSAGAQIAVVCERAVVR